MKQLSRKKGFEKTTLCLLNRMNIPNSQQKEISEFLRKGWYLWFEVSGPHRATEVD